MSIDFGAGEHATDAADAADETAESRAWLNALLAAEARAAARLPPEQLLGRALLRLRLFIGWSQMDLERKSEVDQSTICRLETGKAANVGSARICRILLALQVGDVVLLPRFSTVEPTALELMLHGDPWKRAVAEADRRLSRRRSA